MNEAEYKRRLVAEVKHLGGHARRIEDKWAVGILDLDIKLPGHAFFKAEGKLVEGNLFAPTGSQYAEGVKWIKAGVDAVLIGWQDKAMYISPWVKKADKRDCWMNNRTLAWSDAEALLRYMNENATCASERSN